MNKHGRHILCAVFVIIVAVCTFLKVQTDDEIYMDFNSFDARVSEYDISEGVLKVSKDAITDEEGLFAVSRSVDLPGGSYNIEVDSEGGGGAYLKLMDGETEVFTQELDSSAGRTVFKFDSGREINDFKINFYYRGEGDVTIKHLLLSTPDRSLIYSDNLLLGLLLIAFAVFLDIYTGKNKDIPVSALIGAAAVFVASYPLLSSKFIEGHDMAFHMMRIEGIKDALKSGQFPAVIYPNDAYSHGYLGALYPNIFLYIPALLRLLKVSALNSYRFSFFVINIFSYYTAYLCGRGIARTGRGAVLAAVLYTLAPFRLIDIYFRSTIGEAIALVFLPLVLLGIYNITIGDSSKWRVLFTGMWGLTESHILSAIFGGVLCTVFTLVFIVKLFKEKRIIKLIYAAAATVLGSLMFFVPFFYYRSQDLQLDDTIRRFNPARAAHPMYEIFSSFPRLLTDKDDAYLRREMIPTLGLIGIACIFLTLCLALYDKEKKNERKFVITALVVELAVVYIASDMFPWETLEKFDKLFNELMLLEHPWRLFALSICIFSPIAALALERVEWLKANHTVISLTLAVLTLITVVAQFDIIFNNRSREIDIQTGNTAYSYNVDYMPSKFESMEALRNDDAPLVEGSVLRLPILYYKGYRAFDADGNSLTVREGKFGDVCVELGDSDAAGVTVKFTQPVGNILALIISVLGIIGVLGWEKRGILKSKVSLKK